MSYLILSSWGTTVSKEGACLLVRNRQAINREEVIERRRVPVISLTGVVASQAVSMTSPAQTLLLEHGIPIVWTKGSKILGVTHPFHSHGTVLTRRAQFLAYRSSDGIKLAAAFVKGGLRNKENLLRSYAKNRANTAPAVADQLVSAANRIARIRMSISTEGEGVDAVRAHLMGLEGSGTECYHQALVQLLPHEYDFTKRTRRFPKDPLNSALSYAYVILNSRALLAVVAAGLDPYGGFLHADRSGRPSLAIDLAEEFRQPVVDRAVVDLALRRSFDLQEDFNREGTKVLLSKSGKAKLVARLQERFGASCTVDGEHTTIEAAILRQARKIIHFLLGKKRKYQPYIAAW
ncbi:MAG: CRISPR-associated endonuclease Cas1 [Candidatus Heimdallarchaeota archaeon]